MAIPGQILLLIVARLSYFVEYFESQIKCKSYVNILYVLSQITLGVISNGDVPKFYSKP